VFTRPVKSARPPLAVPPRPGPAPRSSSHLPGLWVTRHQRGFTHVRPSGLPLASAPGWNGNRFGFFPELRTPQLPATHVRAGTDSEHWPEAMPPTSPALHPASSLATCDLVSHDLRPVLHAKHPFHPLARLEPPESSGRGSKFRWPPTFREVLIPSLIKPAEIHVLNLSLLATSQRGSFSWFGKVVGLASGLLDGARRLTGVGGGCPAAEEL